MAAFHFTALPNFYTRTGRLDNVSVIGVALYWEKPVPQITCPWREAPPIAEEAGREGTWRQDRAVNGARSARAFLGYLHHLRALQQESGTDRDHPLRQLGESRVHGCHSPANALAAGASAAVSRNPAAPVCARPSWPIKEKRARINARDEAGRTALMRAAGQGHARVVHYLLRMGADAALSDKAGRNAVAHAQLAGHGALARQVSGTP